MGKNKRKWFYGKSVSTRTTALDTFNGMTLVDKHEREDVAQPEKADTWRVDTPLYTPTVATGCNWKTPGASPATPKRIVLTEQIARVMRTLCHDIVVEWQLLLRGAVSDDGCACVDYIVPKQQVTYTSVVNDDDMSRKRITRDNIVCVVHSHGAMATFWSGTDTDETMATADVQYFICTNNAGNLLGAYVETLPCGMKRIVEVPVTVESETCAVRGIENITKSTATYRDTTITGFTPAPRDYAEGYCND